MDSRVGAVCELFCGAGGRAADDVQHGRKYVAKRAYRLVGFVQRDVGVVAVPGNFGAGKSHCRFSSTYVVIGRSSSHSANDAESRVGARHVDISVVWPRHSSDCDGKRNGFSGAKLDHLQQCQYDHSDITESIELPWTRDNGKDAQWIGGFVSDKHCSVCGGPSDD